MLTINAIIHTKLQTTPFITDALQKNLINITKLARLWHSDIQEQTKKTVTIDAIAMTIRRAISNLEKSLLRKTPTGHSTNPTQITLRSNLIEFTYLKSSTILRSYKRLTDTIHQDDDTFFTISMGIHEITIITDQKLEILIQTAFKEEKGTTYIKNLAAVILKLPDIVIQTPGSYYTFLGKLTWSGINIQEVVSTSHELIIIVEQSLSHRALQCLTSTTATT